MKDQTQFCQFVNAECRPCDAPAVKDAGKWGPAFFPRCEQHRSQSRKATRDHVEKHRHKRALQRGIVSQAEMFARLELEFERRLKSWQWGAGYKVDGSRDHWDELHANDER